MGNVNETSEKSCGNEEDKKEKESLAMIFRKLGIT